MIILIDCDGVLANFDKAILQLLKKEFDIELDLEEYRRHWDFSEVPGLRKYKDRIRPMVEQTSGFCLNMETYPGALEFTRAVRDRGHTLLSCTSVMGGPYPSERMTWLTQRGFHRHDVIMVYRKELIEGDVLIDDRAENIEKWAENHPNGLAIYWKAPGRIPEPVNSILPNVCLTGSWRVALGAIDLKAKD